MILSRLVLYFQDNSDARLFLRFERHYRIGYFGIRQMAYSGWRQWWREAFSTAKPAIEVNADEFGHGGYPVPREMRLTDAFS
jgi:hypothetical protein|tara:strand:- start:209 stop:454 length:246 start_codon:yes stop_codon:yes gene_type:complete